MALTKRAFISGGGAGIGRAVVERFLDDGMFVSVIERQPELLEDLKSERLLVTAGDVRSFDDVRKAVQLTVTRFGGLDILVNNAGIEGTPRSVIEETEEGWDEVLGTNLKGVFIMSKFAVPAIIGAGGGAVVNLASVLALVGDAHFSAYCASKGGIVALTRAMAVDFAPAGVRVNAVCPSAVDTPMLRREAGWHGQDPEAKLAAWGAAPPLPRLATPGDVAGAVRFLASDDAAYITGALIVVDGGLSSSQRIPAQQAT